MHWPCELVKVSLDSMQLPSHTLTELTRSADMWSKVNQLLHPRHIEAGSDLVTADTLNSHYASIGTDSMYTKIQSQSQV